MCRALHDAALDCVGDATAVLRCCAEHRRCRNVCDGPSTRREAAVSGALPVLPHRCLRRITARVVARMQLIPAPTMRSLVPKEEVFVPSPVTPTQVWVACGPFTSHKNLEFAELNDMLSAVCAAPVPPDAVVLVSAATPVARPLSSPPPCHYCPLAFLRVTAHHTASPHLASSLLVLARAGPSLWSAPLCGLVRQMGPFVDAAHPFIRSGDGLVKDSEGQMWPLAFDDIVELKGACPCRPLAMRATSWRRSEE